MNKIKNIIPSFLFLFVIGGIVYFVFVLPHKERIKQEGIQQREKLKIENEIKKMVIKWNAITDWKERFDEKIKNSELITTLDFQNNLINDKNRPILVFGAILDIERKADNIYLVTTIDALGFDLKTCFIISLSSKQYEERYAKELGLEQDQVVAICAKVEADLASLSQDEQKEYLKELGTNESALDKLIQKAFKTLGLITFLTAGEKEVRAWTIRRGMTSLMASGVIHTDFMAKFIKADVVDFVEFIKAAGWKSARELGKVRSEGRDYIVKDGDVIEFKIGS